MLKTIIRVARDLYTYRYFNDSRRAPRYRGVYPSFRAAEAALPKNKPRGFNLDQIPQYFMEVESTLNPRDYPILFWLSQVLRPHATVFDLGGGFGQSYYCFQNFFSFPEGVRWVVCDVESFVAPGAELARKRNASRLTITTDPRMADGAQIYLTKGALQYIEPDLRDLLRQLASKPEHILVNRVPMYNGEPYFTQQNSNHSYAVNKIVNELQFVREIEDLGYEKIDAWSSPRTLHIPFHPDRFVSGFKGFYFRRRNASTGDR